MSTTIALRVSPRSSRDAVEGVDRAGELCVRVTAPPADGAANAAVIKLVAKELRVPKRAVSVVSGAASRHKRLRVEGVEPTVLLARWPGASVSAG